MLTTKQFIKKVEELGYTAELVKEYDADIGNVFISKKDEDASPLMHEDAYDIVVCSVYLYKKAVHFRENHLFDNELDIIPLITEYVNTPQHERIAEEKYYIHWTDFDGTMYFLDDNCLKDNYYGNNSEFNSVEHLVETEEEDVYHYQFTESDIKKIPKQWRPLEFGGIGFTQAINV